MSDDSAFRAVEETPRPPAPLDPTAFWAGDLGHPPPVPPDGPLMAIVLPEEPAKPRRAHPNFWWAILWCIGFVVLTQIPATLVATGWMVTRIFVTRDRQALEHMRGGGDPMAAPVVAQGLAVGLFYAEILVIVVSWLAIRVVVGPDWMRRLAVRRPSLPHLALVLVAFPAVTLLGEGAYAMAGALGVPSISDWGVPGVDKMGEIFNQWYLPFAVLVIGLGPGIGEELWCRGFLGRGLVGRYGFVIGVVLSSFFFGLIHMDPRQGTMAAIMGLALHFVYVTTRSLWMPVLLHFLNNSLSVLMLRIPGHQTIETPVYAYFAAGVVLAAVFWALYRSRARLMAIDGGEPWQPEYAGVEHPPPGSGTVVVRPHPGRLAWGLVTAAVLLAFPAWGYWGYTGYAAVLSAQDRETVAVSSPTSDK
jgi:membrane protease YdiL (CAAX protease family)